MVIRHIDIDVVLKQRYEPNNVFYALNFLQYVLIYFIHTSYIQEIKIDFYNHNLRYVVLWNQPIILTTYNGQKMPVFIEVYVSCAVKLWPWTKHHYHFKSFDKETLDLLPLDWFFPWFLKKEITFPPNQLLMSYANSVNIIYILQTS